MTITNEIFINVGGKMVKYILEEPKRKCLVEHIKKISTPYFFIRTIKNPTEAEQLASVDKLPLSIKYIKNPSEKVQLAAVTKNLDSIQYIKNPSEAVKKLCFKYY